MTSVLRDRKAMNMERIGSTHGGGGARTGRREERALMEEGGARMGEESWRIVLHLSGHCCFSFQGRSEDSNKEARGGRLVGGVRIYLSQMGAERDKFIVFPAKGEQARQSQKELSALRQAGTLLIQELSAFLGSHHAIPSMQMRTVLAG